MAIPFLLSALRQDAEFGDYVFHKVTGILFNDFGSEMRALCFGILILNELATYARKVHVGSQKSVLAYWVTYVI